ncbi:MAG: acetyltransferase [Saprospiraceae bacterium]|nr:acetyltransferase [Saprospiraceae bacterium]
MKDIAIYGAGGFGKEVACLINQINNVSPKWKLVGFFDDGVMKDTQISHFGKVLGGIDELQNVKSKLGIVFAIGSPNTIKKIVDKITNPSIDFPNIIQPDVVFADIETFRIGKGNVIVRGCTFSCDVTIGDFNQFNSISALAHDVSVGSFNVFMPLTRISGGSQIGNMNFFGIGSVVLQNIKIGNQTKVSAGSYVMRNTRDGFLYAGNPAKKYDI